MSSSRWIQFVSAATATAEIYTLSLHDALPISPACRSGGRCPRRHGPGRRAPRRGALPTAAAPAGGRLGGQPPAGAAVGRRSEEHTSELQSQSNLVCRLLLEKKKRTRKYSRLFH